MTNTPEGAATRIEEAIEHVRHQCSNPPVPDDYHLIGTVTAGHLRQIIAHIKSLTARLSSAERERDEARAEREAYLDALTEIGPGLLVLRNMLKTAGLKLGHQRAVEIIDKIRPLIAGRAESSPQPTIKCGRCGETFAETPDGCRDFDCPLKE